MRSMLLGVLAAALACVASPAGADDRADMEKFMADYLVLWNAHDAAAITTGFYRLDAKHPWSSTEGLKAEFDRLIAQGYTTSEIHGVTGCALGPDTGQVELRFTRLTADGGFMPPKDRTSLYRVRKFADGWRVTGMSALPAGERMTCPAA
jgi:hypothetical protein